MTRHASWSPTNVHIPLWYHPHSNCGCCCRTCCTTNYIASHPRTHLHADYCSLLTHLWNTYSDPHSKKRRKLITGNWRFFEICGPYLYSNTHPPSPLLWTGLLSSKKDTGEVSIRTANLTLSSMDTAKRTFRLMACMRTHVWNANRAHTSRRTFCYR